VRRSKEPKSVSPYNPRCCADCGLDTIERGEWFMVHDEIWQQAWGHIERGNPGRQILCIGCLERRIGRTLMACDFTDAPLNDPFAREVGVDVSERLFDRLIAKQPLINDRCALDDYFARHRAAAVGRARGHMGRVDHGLRCQCRFRR